MLLKVVYFHSCTGCFQCVQVEGGGCGWGALTERVSLRNRVHLAVFWKKTRTITSWTNQYPLIFLPLSKEAFCMNHYPSGFVYFSERPKCYRSKRVRRVSAVRIPNFPPSLLPPPDFSCLVFFILFPVFLEGMRDWELGFSAQHALHSNYASFRIFVFISPYCCG